MPDTVLKALRSSLENQQAILKERASRRVDKFNKKIQEASHPSFSKNIWNKLSGQEDKYREFQPFSEEETDTVKTFLQDVYAEFLKIERQKQDEGLRFNDVGRAYRPSDALRLVLRRPNFRQQVFDLYGTDGSQDDRSQFVTAVCNGIRQARSTTFPANFYDAPKSASIQKMQKIAGRSILALATGGTSFLFSRKKEKAFNNLSASLESLLTKDVDVVDAFYKNLDDILSACPYGCRAEIDGDRLTSRLRQKHNKNSWNANESANGGFYNRLPHSFENNPLRDCAAGKLDAAHLKKSKFFCCHS
jgi:hypothetical protein